MTSGQLWEGHQPRDCGEHRTVGAHRAWCYDCGEWCYPQLELACRGCELPKLRQQLAELTAPSPHDDLGGSTWLLAGVIIPGTASIVVVGAYTNSLLWVCATGIVVSLLTFLLPVRCTCDTCQRRREATHD